MKPCTKCHKELPLTAFRTRTQRGVFQHIAACRSCEAANAKARAEAKKEDAPIYVADPLNLALRDFSYITNRGQLRPSIGFNNRRAA